MDLINLFKALLIASCCHARVLSAPRQARLSLAEPNPYYFYNNIDGHPGTYSYGYDVSDPATGNTQYRTEERYPNGTVVGSYGYIDAWGKPRRYQYIADHNGYRLIPDRPSRPYGQPMTMPPQNFENIPEETSVTWTRPKNPKKNKNNFNINTNYVNRPNLLAPPSFYAAYE